MVAWAWTMGVDSNVDGVDVGVGVHGGVAASPMPSAKVAWAWTMGVDGGVGVDGGRGGFLTL